MADKEAILASLNIKAMTFDDTIGTVNHRDWFSIMNNNDFFLRPDGMNLLPPLHSPLVLQRSEIVQTNFTHRTVQERLNIRSQRADDNGAGQRQQRPVP